MVISGTAITSASHVATLNPFRYRGYYYDTETGLYYVSSRYYDPETCRFINADALVDNRSVLGANLVAYCLNNPIMNSDPTGLCALAWAKGYQGPCPGLGKPGCMDNGLQIQNTPAIVAPVKSTLDPTRPPDHPDYTPPKKGGDKKVKNPNGKGNGWPAKDGGVWVPTPGMHGGDGWTVQYPDGSHWHGYPGGGVRKAQKQSNPIVGGVTVIFGVIAIGYLAINDITVVGVADDALMPVPAGCIVAGVNMIGGHYNCDCGESWYGFR